jgi:hypothetical protein
LFLVIMFMHILMLASYLCVTFILHLFIGFILS